MTTDCTGVEMSRRTLLRGAIGVGVTTALFGTTFVQAAFADRPGRRVVVVLSLRGAADGLSLVVPHGDPAYYRARPRIAVPATTLVAKDDFFGLHPELAPLLPMWRAGRMAVVHATGLPTPNRSHFAAMEEVESADPGSSTRVGWLNRLVGRDAAVSTTRGIGLGTSTPITALYGPHPTVTATSIDHLALSGADDPRRRRALDRTWSGAAGTLGRGARSALAVATRTEKVRRGPKSPANGATYLDDDLGRALAASARIIRGDLGTEVLAIDHDGGWDMHSGLGTLEWGTMVRATRSLARNLAAFFVDLGGRGDDVTVVTISEFGRRLRENDNYGTDHGHGNVMFLLGGGVRGGYHGTWQRLSDASDDVPVTTDYRHVLAELVGARLGASAGTVFPRFAPRPVGAVVS